MTSLFDRTGAPLVVLGASVAALLLALIAQYGFQLQPCVLCIYQRWPYVAAALLALLALLLPGRWRWFALAAAGIALAVGGGIAAFHVGVEEGWWAGTAACGSVQGTPQDLAALKQQLLATPVVRCDEAAFRLFGISMAGYNFLYACGLFLFTVAAVLRAQHEDARP